MMIALLPLTLFVIWAVFEWSGWKHCRRVAGCLLGAIATTSFIITSSLARFDANSYCNGAASDLLSNSVRHLERGRTDAVLRAWRTANGRIDGGGYEFREDFAAVVHDAVAAMEH